MAVERDAENDGWIMKTETTGWPLGTTYIEIAKGAGENRFIYRTHFELNQITKAADKTNLPMSFTLFQNYPNPFNPQTFIKIELPHEAFISLDVFDIRGRKIRSLVSSIQPGGEYIVPWDGLNDFGQPLTSGIYYYRMQSEDFVDIKRMILLR